MSVETLVEMGLGLVGIYVAAGLIAAAALHLGGLRRIDPGVEGSGVMFRLLVTPGMVALWPFLIRRWRLAARGAPIYGETEGIAASWRSLPSAISKSPIWSCFGPAPRKPAISGQPSIWERSGDPESASSSCRPPSGEVELWSCIQ